MKSYVTLAQKQCAICGKTYDTGELLMDTRLKETFDMHTLTGIGICPEHKKEGYLILIEIDESKSKPDGKFIKPENAYKTGRIAHIKINKASEMFGENLAKFEFIFIQQEAFEQIIALMPENNTTECKNIEKQPDGETYCNKLNIPNPICDRKSCENKEK